VRLNFCAMLFALLLASSARAGSAALTLYRQGEYERAIAAASAENSADGFALAARAAMAEAMMRSPCLECLKRAEDFARKSISTNPDLADGHVYLATSLGYQARIIGAVRARLGGYPEEAKHNLDKALASDPKNAWALAALGGWNIEIERGGGVYLARWLYGASLTAGQKYFEAAFKSAPDNLVLRYQYALSLAGLDIDEWASLVSEELTRAVSATPQTAYEKFAQGRARELLTALNKNDYEKFNRLVRRDQGYS
jgi:tetratricopeptide (TPR) repeat protein